MTPASRLPIEPDDRVLDLCAAPGGKATELGSRIGEGGMLLANVSAIRGRRRCCATWKSREWDVFS